MLTRLRGGGSALPGLVVEKLSPSFLVKTALRLPEGTIIITGTNGKTTTSKMLRTILEASHKTVVANRAGSNLSRGIVSTLLEHSSWSGHLRGEIGLFEIDEAYVPIVARQLKPRAIVVLNLLRDQLDRYGELDRTANLVANGLAYTGNVVLNADDPLVAKLGQDAPNAKVVFFGAASHLRSSLPDDSSLFKRIKRGLASALHPQQPPAVLLKEVISRGGHQRVTYEVEGQIFKNNLPLDGIYNAYNAAAAVAVAGAVDIKPKEALEAMEKVEPAFGRTELVELGGKKLQILLVKNPSGFNQIINTFMVRSKGQRLLMAVNDKIADGRDVSWLWDVDFEPLARYKHHILTTGIRGLDLGVRLKYAEVVSEHEPKLNKALHAFIRSLGDDEIGYVVPTYTAMLELRKLLGKQVKLPEVWE